MSNRIAAVAGLVTLATASAWSAHQAAACPPTDQAPLNIVIPLDDGRLDVRQALEALCTQFQVPCNGCFDGIDLKVNIGPIVQGCNLQELSRLSGGCLSASLTDKELVVRIKPAQLDPLPQPIPPSTGEEGLRFIIDGRRAPVDQLAEPPPARAVILIHGLGRTGFIWNDLIPELQAAGHFVGSFEYNTDRSIADSADQLALALKQARAAGIQRVDIVAHSMGGLVARDLLTRPGHYNGNGLGAVGLPTVDRLIMLGTPNDGSTLARLTDLGLMVDLPVGAATDLLPQSDFLRALNARPLPAHTRISIVAARCSPLSSPQIGTLVQRAADALKSDDHASSWNRWLTHTAQRWSASVADKVVDGLGDGLVAIESTRLAGVDDYTLIPANHMTMLFRPLPTEDLPPAIPIVLDRLALEPARP